MSKQRKKGASLIDCERLHTKELVIQRRSEEDAAKEKAALLLERAGYKQPHPEQFKTVMEFLEADKVYRDKLSHYYCCVLKGTMRLL